MNKSFTLYNDNRHNKKLINKLFTLYNDNKHNKNYKS